MRKLKVKVVNVKIDEWESHRGKHLPNEVELSLVCKDMKNYEDLDDMVADYLLYQFGYMPYSFTF